MLKKEVIKKNQPVQGKFLSNVFLVWNKDRYHRSVINLKMLNRFVSFLHFKMEGLSQLKHLIQERNWMCKPDLKEAYFIVPLDWSSKKFARLHRNGTLYEFMWLCFGLGPAHRVFTKLLKVPISSEKNEYQNYNLFGRYVDFESHNICTDMSWGTVIYLLQNLSL